LLEVAAVGRELRHQMLAVVEVAALAVIVVLLLKH
jgi:hypothetical protein